MSDEENEENTEEDGDGSAVPMLGFVAVAFSKVSAPKVAVSVARSAARANYIGLALIALEILWLRSQGQPDPYPVKYGRPSPEDVKTRRQLKCYADGDWSKILLAKEFSENSKKIDAAVSHYLKLIKQARPRVPTIGPGSNLIRQDKAFDRVLDSMVGALNEAIYDRHIDYGNSPSTTKMRIRKHG
jgi:hypothetical protein